MFNPASYLLSALTDRPLIDAPMITSGPAGPDPIGRLLRDSVTQERHRAGWPLPGHGAREVARRLRQRAALSSARGGESV